MSVALGGKGLVVGGGGGGGSFVNPYGVIAGNNSSWMSDNPALTHAAITGGEGIVSIETASAIVSVPVLYQQRTTAPPYKGTINAGKPGFHFDINIAAKWLLAWDAAYDVTDGTSGFTLYTTVKTTRSGFQVVYCKGAGQSRWKLLLDSGGFAAFELTDAVGPTEHMIDGDNPIDDGQIHRIIAIWDPANAPGVTMTLYVDGVLQAATDTFAGTLQTVTDPVAFGALADANNNASFTFDGDLGDTGSYNRPLRGAEISQLDALMIARNT